MGSIRSLQDAMAYQSMSIYPQDCKHCTSGKQQSDGLRCTKGSFFVAPVATCKHFHFNPNKGAPMQSIITIAEGGYHAYSKTCNHKTHDGMPLPSWELLGVYRQQCWQAAVTRIAGLRDIVSSAEFLAAEAWDAYSKEANGLAHDGATLPAWQDLPLERKDAWQASATHILAALATQ
jgi:hypothetical protein